MMRRAAKSCLTQVALSSASLVPSRALCRARRDGVRAPRRARQSGRQFGTARGRGVRRALASAAQEVEGGGELLVVRRVRRDIGRRTAAPSSSPPFFRWPFRLASPLVSSLPFSSSGMSCSDLARRARCPWPGSNGRTACSSAPWSGGPRRSPPSGMMVCTEPLPKERVPMTSRACGPAGRRPRSPRPRRSRH